MGPQSPGSNRTTPTPSPATGPLRPTILLGANPHSHPGTNSLPILSSGLPSILGASPSDTFQAPVSPAHLLDDSQHLLPGVSTPPELYGSLSWE